MMNPKPWRATLALSGGGARGIAHLGAIEELLYGGLAVERVVGVSIGSLAGAMFAFEPDIIRVQQKTREYLRSPEFLQHQKNLFGAHQGPVEKPEGNLRAGYHRIADFVRANRMLYRGARRSSLLPGTLLESVVSRLLPNADIADAAVPLSIVAVDLHTGLPVVFDKGPVRLAVRASASVPGIFPPVPYEGRLLSDIGGFSTMPLRVARTYGPETVVAVDVDGRLKPMTDSPTALEVLVRMIDIGSVMFREHLREEADLSVLPDVKDVPWFDFRLADAMMEAGRVAARTALRDFVPPRGWLKRFFMKRHRLGIG
jgi:NTE family protein